MEVVCDKDLIKSIYDYFVKDNRYNLSYKTKRIFENKNTNLTFYN